MINFKKFGALFMALMLIVLGFGNIGTVFAEDGDSNDIYLNNGYKTPMVIDDPANFDYVKYWIDNYEYGTNINLASNVEISIITEMNGHIIGLYFVNPLNSDKVQPDTMNKEYFMHFNKSSTYSHIELSSDDVLKRVIEEQSGLNFVISPDFKTPIASGSGYIYVTPEYLKSKLPMIRECMNNKTDLNSEPRNRLNYHGSHGFYSNKDNFKDELAVRNIVITAPGNLSKYNLPENLDSNLKEDLNDCYKDGHFIFKANSILDVEIKPFTEDIIKKFGLTGIAGYYTFINHPGVGLSGGLKDEIATFTILKYNHEAKYVSNNKLKFGEKKYKEGTPNVVLGSSEFLYLKNELNKMDKNSKEYKEYEEYFKNLASINEIYIKNTLSFLNSDKWSATPLTYEIGNVDTKTEILQYNTIEKEDPTLLKGERKVEVIGKNGEKVTTITYEVDEKTGELKNPVSEEKITDPIDEVIAVGTKVKPEDPRKDADLYIPEGKDLTVNVGDEPKAEDAITNKKYLPEGTKYEWKDIPDTTKPGEYTGQVEVTFKDGSSTIVDVKIIVKEKETKPEEKPETKKYPDGKIEMVGNNNIETDHINLDDYLYFGSPYKHERRQIQKVRFDIDDNKYVERKALPIRSDIKTNKSEYPHYIFTIGDMTYIKVTEKCREPRKMDVKPYLKNERIMLPLRYVGEALNADVTWDNNSRTAYFTRDGITARIQIDGNKIELSNGRVFTMDTKPDNINGRIFVPITNVSQVFTLTNGNTTDGIKQNIEWDQQDYTTTVYPNR